MSVCTESCRAPVKCQTCDRFKAPRGRDVAAAAGGSLCTAECAGYMRAPTAGHLWPDESITPEDDETPVPVERER